MKKVAIIQSNYIPWKGYFDIIHDSELFIFHDDLQYTKDDWRNRNKIKTSTGLRWLTIPVGRNEHRLICDVEITDIKWQRKHYDILRQTYFNAPFFKLYETFLREIYLEKKWNNLSELNQYLIKTISRDFLGIKTEFMDSRSFIVNGVKHEKLLNLVIAAGTQVYVSGPAAKHYIIEKDYEDAGIQIIWKDYTGYPEYPQSFDNFCHYVSTLDLLFYTGNNAPYYIWGWRDVL